MIYVPEYNNGNCAYMQSNNVIRVYESRPSNGATIHYRDYMLDNHYLFRDGEQTFSQYSTLPTCLDDSLITQNFGYRTDLADILIIFFLIVGFIYFVISRLWRALFKGGRLL